MPPEETMTPEEQKAYDEALIKIEACRRRGSRGTSLGLSFLRLRRVPPELGDLKFLSGINLSRNQLTSVPPELGQLKSLAGINLSENHLSSVPAELGQLKSLTYLNLTGNQLTSVPAELGQLESLTELDLRGNQLTSVPAELGQLKSLTKLKLSDNQLTSLPAELGQLESLTELNLSGNQLTSVPAELGQLKSVRVLDLSRNQLTSVPSEMGKLKSLSELRLSGNKLTSVSAQLGQLESLTELILYGNHLTSVPAELGQLTSLTRLNLSGNQLTGVPEELGQLKSLTEFLLFWNELTSVPAELGQLTSLLLLDISDNQLASVPAEFGQLKSLKWVFLSANQLASVPVELGQLKSLTQLELVGNQLTSVPAELGQLESLTDLNLSGNQLTSVPAELGQLKSLTDLNLSGNQLTSVPAELGQLKSLIELYLHENPKLGIPSEVLGPSREKFLNNNAQPASPKAILDYYFSKQEQGEAPMQEVRLLMVGRGRVGKTSLLKVLRGEKPDRKEEETPGITVLPLDLDCEQGPVRGHAWDFGGQEFLHGTHQIFLSERCVYVLVLEGRESNWESETDYWLRFIQSFGGDSPVIVALNKYDAHAFSVDQFRLQERCPQIVGFVETDAFAGRGVEELRGLLETTTNGMPDVWLGVPKKWHAVKEALVQTKESFLEYKAYQGLCVDKGVEDDGHQASLAEVLHRLGIALNFRDHHRLRQTSVLKPEWVTEGIYGLLRYAQKQECHGVLERAWIGKALPVKGYPAEKHGFVMELMEKFEVAFALEAESGKGREAKEPQRWLIPELLPEVQPEAFEEFRAAGVRRVRFRYPEALPPGLLPRLIVRTHELSEAHPNWRWRSGVVLEWGEARALVRLNRSERRTEVAVTGNSEEDTQSLFDTLRAHLTVLHGKVPVVEEMQALDDPEKWVEMRELRRAEIERDETIKVIVSDDPRVPRASVPVKPTLNKVESQEARDAEGLDAPERMRLFVSYAHDDASSLKPLSKHLTILGRRGYIQTWDDTQLIAGEDWEKKIFEELGRADIVLLLYSTASRASGFIQDKEAPRAIELVRETGCTLIVVPLDRKDWDDAVTLEKKLKKLQTATWNAKPVLDFTPQRGGWLEVEQAIRKAVEDRRKRGGI